MFRKLVNHELLEIPFQLLIAIIHNLEFSCLFSVQFKCSIKSFFLKLLSIAHVQFKFQLMCKDLEFTVL